MTSGDLSARAAAAKEQVSLSALIGRVVKLRRAGREFVGPCPFHQERTPSFSVVEEKGFYHCFGCGAHGDAVDFLRAHDGLDFKAAVERLESDAGLQGGEAVVRRNSRRPERPSDFIDGRAAAAMVWRDARPARGTLAEAFLHSRGLDPDANGLLDVARFHPFCPAALWRRWEGPGDARRHAPALVAPMLRISGGPGKRVLSLAGVHLTFLAGDGRKKAFEPWFKRDGTRIDPPSRVMWGGAARAAVVIPARAAAASVSAAGDRGEAVKEWLLALLDAPGLAVVGEGLESTQSLMARCDNARVGFATLSLGNLQGAAARVGAKHALPLWNPRPAEEGRPFTLAEGGHVLIGVDSDMKPTQPVWVQDRPRRPAEKRALSGRERAELCGALAAAHWRQVGASSVRIARPPMGEDFNDQDQRRAG